MSKSIKKYNIQYNIGRVKYVVNHYNGVDVHKDGSPFYSVATFRNKKKMDTFVKKLESEEYKYA